MCARNKAVASSVNRSHTRGSLSRSDCRLPSRCTVNRVALSEHQLLPATSVGQQAKGICNKSRLQQHTCSGSPATCLMRRYACMSSCAMMLPISSRGKPYITSSTLTVHVCCCMRGASAVLMLLTAPAWPPHARTTEGIVLQAGKSTAGSFTQQTDSTETDPFGG